MRLQAIREYMTQHSCEHTPPLTTTGYVVTFALEGGIVVANCTFTSKKQADLIVDAVNKSYDEQGESQHNKSKWEE